MSKMLENEVEDFFVCFVLMGKDFKWPDSAAIVGSDCQKIMLCTRENKKRLLRRCSKIIFCLFA